jgi:hypothetical protein
MLHRNRRIEQMRSARKPQRVASRATRSRGIAERDAVRRPAREAASR